MRWMLQSPPNYQTIGGVLLTDSEPAADDRRIIIGEVVSTHWTLMAKSPKFKNPPVVETVLGVQFPELEGFRAVHFGRYSEMLGSRYPEIEDHTRLDPIREERFPRTPIIPIPHFQIMQGAPLNRTWFTADSKSELIQLQPDRYLFNWRGQGGQYPSYNANSELFFNEFEAFCNFCEEQEGLSLPKPEICEVTYVNHIDPIADESVIDLAGKVYTGLQWETVNNFLPKPDSVTFNRTYVISDRGKPIGRLYVESSIAMRREVKELREFIILKLTSRVNHDANEGQNLRESMQIAHDWVVKGFADLTESQIQKDRWERQS